MDRGIKRRLDALEESIDRNSPCQMKITFVDGSTTVTGVAGALGIMQNLEQYDGKVINVEANQPGYEGLAGLLAALCRPAPNRRIEDYV